METPRKISYLLVALILVMVGTLHMATPFITVLFGVFALNFLRFGSEKRWPALVGFFLLLSGILFAGFFFTKRAVIEVPKMATTAIPAIVEFAESRGLDLPFSDYPSLKALAMHATSEKLGNLGRYARTGAVELVSLIIGLVVAVSLFLNPRGEFGEDPHAIRDNLYALTGREMVLRFRTFYESFATVMGAQLIISLINTVFTSFFLIWAGFPHVVVILGLTFLFGLLPIIGNLLSNTLIVGVGFTISPKLALMALVFLVVLHKSEYFLNSKIIGERIKNPMWMTLLGLVIGEKLAGIPGMILAPVVLHFIKVEASKNRVSRRGPESTTSNPERMAA